MIRLSVSDLESYRYWLAQEDSTLDDLLRRLRRQEPPHPRMEAGRAFAQLLEHAEEGEIDGRTVDGWRFVFAIDEAFNLPTARELKAEDYIVETPHGPVTLVAQTDGLTGLVVRDQKLTERPDPEKYIDSWQWRAYLTIFKAKKFIYDLFGARFAPDMRELERMRAENDWPNGFTPCVTVTSYDQVPFYAYPGMEADVRRAVCDVAEVIARHSPERVMSGAA